MLFFHLVKLSFSFFSQSYDCFEEAFKSPQKEKLDLCEYLLLVLVVNSNSHSKWARLTPKLYTKLLDCGSYTPYACTSITSPRPSYLVWIRIVLSRLTKASALLKKTMLHQFVFLIFRDGECLTRK